MNMNIKNRINLSARFGARVSNLARSAFVGLMAFGAIAPTMANAQSADPYAFEKKAYKTDGTPWVGPVNVGDTVKYVLSYKPGTTNSGPATIVDTLSPNQSYAAPTTGPGWTWGGVPYSTGNAETYSSTGFGPGNSVKVTVGGIPKPISGSGDGTIPVPVPSVGKVFGVYHHGSAIIDCWNLSDLSKCGGTKSGGAGLLTPLTPQSVVRGSKFFFPAYRPNGTATFGCFDAASNAACADTPVSAPVSNYGQVGGVVEDGAGRLFLAVKEKVFCMTESGGTLSACGGAWPATGLVSVTTPVFPASASKDVYLLAEFSPSPTKIYIHHGDAVLQCLDTATATPCAGWTGAGYQVPSKSRGTMLSSLPASGASGDGGVCLWDFLGPLNGCVGANGSAVAISGVTSVNGVVPVSSLRIPNSGKVLFPDYEIDGPECYNFSGTTATACPGFPIVWAAPYSSAGSSGAQVNGSQYGFAVDPLDPENCVLVLGHENMLWRLDHTKGQTGCGTTTVSTPPIDQLFCNGAPDPTKFQWSSINVTTASAAGVLTITQGISAPATVTLISGTTNYAMPSTIALGYGPLTFSYAPAGGSPTAVDLVVGYTSDKNPEICYQTKVTKCGPVFNEAVFKAAFNGSPVTSTKKVDLGLAKGPSCDVVDPPKDTTSCLSADPKVTCGKTPGTYVVTLKTNSNGPLAPDFVTLTPKTVGVTIVNPQVTYPVIGGVVKITVAGANPGDVIQFDMEGTIQGAGSVEGSDLCCNGPIKVTIPKDLNCADKKLVDLSIKKTGATSPAPGVNGYSFNMAVTNVGAPFNGTNAVTVTDVVPAGMTFNSATSPDWACATLPANAGSTMTCTYTGAGPVSAGQSMGSIAISATATGQAPFPPFTNCAEVGTLPASPYADTNPTNNKSCVTVKKPDASTIKVTKVCLPAKEIIGAINSYVADCKITVTTTGPQTALIVVNEAMTGGGTVTSAVSSSTPAWTCTTANCSINGSALNQTSSTSVIDVKVSFPNAAAVLTSQNCAKLSVGQNPVPAPDGESCTKFTTIVNPPVTGTDVSLLKSWTQGATPFAGKFTLKVKNNATTEIATPQVIKFVDQVPAGMVITSVDPVTIPHWTCLPVTVTGPGSLTCTYAGAMPVAAGVTLPDVVLNATLAPAVAPKTEPLIYSNCAKTDVHTSSTGPAATDTTPANNTGCAVTEDIIDNCLMTGTCPTPPALTCQSDVLMVVDRSASIPNPAGVQTALNNFITPMKNKGGKLEILYFASKNHPAPTPTVNVLFQPTMGAPAIPPLAAASGGYTNWDNALKAANTIASTPKFVLFVTDGEPTAYDNAGGTEVAPAGSIIAANEAAPWINSIRMAGSRLMVVGFGPVASMGYLEATFGGTVGSTINSDIIKVANESALQSLMTQLGRQMCGTLNLQKSAAGSIYDTIPATATSKAVAGDVKFQLALTNNSATAVTGIIVEDHFAPLIQAGMPSDAAFTAPSVVGTPSLGTAVFAGPVLSWTIPTLNPGQTATLQFKSGYSATHSHTTAQAWNVPNFAQVKTATGDSQSTAGNMASPITGPVAEADEATASFQIYVNKQIITTNACDVPIATRPAYCTIKAEKKRSVSEGTCDAGQICNYKLAVWVDPANLPAATTINVTDVLTDDGTAVTWPATVTMTGGTCTAAPTTAGFTCSFPKPATATTLLFDVAVSVPVGTTGLIKNCIGAVLANAGAPLDGRSAVGGYLSNSVWTGQLCAQHTINPPTAKIIQTVIPVCDPATATNAGDLCRCRFDNMTPVSKTACECKEGYTLKAGQGCIKKVVEPVCNKSERYQPERKRCEPVCAKGFDYSVKRNVCVEQRPDCKKGFEYNAKRNACVQLPPVCKKGTKLNTARGRCEPVCQKGFDYNSKRNACIQQKPDCKEGTVFNPKRNRCVAIQPVCKAPFTYDAKRNACVKRIEECPRGTISVKGRCLQIPKCPFGQLPIPGTGICVGIGGGGGGGDEPKPRNTDQP